MARLKETSETVIGLHFIIMNLGKRLRDLLSLFWETAFLNGKFCLLPKNRKYRDCSVIPILFNIFMICILLDSSYFFVAKLFLLQVFDAVRRPIILRELLR